MSVPRRDGDLIRYSSSASLIFIAGMGVSTISMSSMARA